MIALEISINGERLCVAGTEDWGLLSTIITANRKAVGADREEDEFDLNIGGLTESDSSGLRYHVRWKVPAIGVGTTITVKIVDVDEVEEPIRRFRSDNEIQESPFTDEEIEQMQREDWMRLKAKFER